MFFFLARLLRRGEYTGKQDLEEKSLSLRSWSMDVEYFGPFRSTEARRRPLRVPFAAEMVAILRVSQKGGTYLIRVIILNRNWHQNPLVESTSDVCFQVRTESIIRIHVSIFCFIILLYSI